VDPGEVCDGADLGGKTCQDLGHSGGALACAADCLGHDTSGCTGGSAVNGRQFGQTCGGSHGSCATGLTCVLFNEAGKQEGYCTAECSDSKPCPSSPAGAQCAFKLTSSGKTICGFLCSSASPACPPGLACTYSTQGQYYYCSTDAPAKCGNGKLEVGEECDGSDLNNTSCKAFGYAGGALTCTSSCKLDKSGCSGPSSCANLPAKDCTAGNAACGKLVLFSPFKGNGYEVTHGTAYSYARTDTMMLIKYAAASVKCMLPGSYPLGLGDMSMSSGGTPKDASGQLRHPQGTHDYGRDVDLAYYQVGQSNNNLRPVCPYTESGKNAYHCTGQPNILDAKRSALFIAKLVESSRVRVIGVDGKIGPLIEAEAQKLYGKGMISGTTLNTLKAKLAYEVTNANKGWYYFHHHHLHLSTWTTSYMSPPAPEPPINAAPSEGMPAKVLPVTAPQLTVAPALTTADLDSLGGQHTERPAVIASVRPLD
jgi:hypothetical protein